MIVAVAQTERGAFSVGRHDSLFTPGEQLMCVVVSEHQVSGAVRIEPWDSFWAVEFRLRLREMGVEVRDAG